MFESARRARSRWINVQSRPNQFLVPRIVTLSFSMMKRNNLKYLPTDKDGGFAICNGLLFDAEINRILNDDNHYAKRTRHPGIAEDCMIEYGIWAEDTAKETGKGRTDMKLLNALMSSWRGKPDSVADDSFYYSLQYTIKTHKVVTVPRVLHCSVDHPMLPGMRMVTKILHDRVIRLPHLYKDTDDFLRKLSRAKLTADCEILKFDIKDYYMSGEHSNITTSCASEVKSAQSKITKKGLGVFLDSQFVQTEKHSKHVYKVTKGAGMGSMYAGDASDLHFYVSAEKAFCLLPAVRREYGIIFYGRFKDDGIIIFSHRSHEVRCRFWNKFQAFANEYKITVDSWSADEAVFLDVRVFKGTDFAYNLKLDYDLYVKPTSVYKPLSPWSSHAKSVHNSWPISQLNRITKRFSNPARAIHALLSFRDQYSRLFGLFLPEKDEIIKTLETTTCNSPRSWLVLPYTPCWAGAALGRALNLVSVPSAMDPVGRCSISWKLGHAHLVHRLRRYGTARA